MLGFGPLCTRPLSALPVTPTPPEPPDDGGAISGGAGHGRRGGRQFPFRNRYDDPELFRRPPPPPVGPLEPVVDQPYVEGDPVNVAPAGPTIVPIRRAPPVMAPLSVVMPPPRERRAPAPAPKPLPS